MTTVFRLDAERVRAMIGTAAFFCSAPGTVVGLVPWLLTRWQIGGPAWYHPTVRLAGALLVTGATGYLLTAFVRFVTEGVGTPAPVAPTRQLVVGGVYRYVRNPMYLAVVGAILGQALLLGRTVLLPYAAAIALLQAGFVRGVEEPRLRSRYGASYDTYRAAVPAWWPRRHAWHQPDQA